MIKNKFIMTVSFFCFTMSMANSSAFAAERESEHEVVRGLLQQGDILPLEAILQHARRYREGRILETELERSNKRYVYEIEILDKHGVVWEMRFDAKSGELIKTEQED